MLNKKRKSQHKKEKIFNNSNKNKNKENFENNLSDCGKEIYDLKNKIHILEDENKQIEKKNLQLIKENEKLKEENKKLNENLNKKDNKINLSVSPIKSPNLIKLKEIKEAEYINPILQCLIYTKPLTDYFLSKYTDSHNNKLSSYYSDLIKKFSKNQNGIYNAESMVDNKCNNSKDFLIGFLEQLDKELSLEKNNSIITNIFGGKKEIKEIPYEKVIKNINVNSEYSDFIYINLNFNNTSANSSVDIINLISNWLLSDKTSNNNQDFYYYPKISKYPKVLILIIENSGKHIKLKFPEELKMTDDTKFLFEKTEKKFIYKLYGVVSKIKNKNTFVAKCLQKDNIWYQINNESFEIINNNFIKEENNEIPLILFYYLKE